LTDAEATELSISRQRLRIQLTQLLLHGRLHDLLLFLIYFFIVDDFVRPTITESIGPISAICMVGKTMAVANQSEISFFSIRQLTWPWQPIFVGCIHATEFR